jgi:hypothetical protein
VNMNCIRVGCGHSRDSHGESLKNPNLAPGTSCSDCDCPAFMPEAVTQPATGPQIPNFWYRLPTGATIAAGDWLWVSTQWEPAGDTTFGWPVSPEAVYIRAAPIPA